MIGPWLHGSSEDQKSFISNINKRTEQPRIVSTITSHQELDAKLRELVESQQWDNCHTTQERIRRDTHPADQVWRLYPPIIKLRSQWEDKTEKWARLYKLRLHEIYDKLDKAIGDDIHPVEHWIRVKRSGSLKKSGLSAGSYLRLGVRTRFNDHDLQWSCVGYGGWVLFYKCKDIPERFWENLMEWRETGKIFIEPYSYFHFYGYEQYVARMLAPYYSKALRFHIDTEITYVYSDIRQDRRWPEYKVSNVGLPLGNDKSWEEVPYWGEKRYRQLEPYFIRLWKRNPAWSEACRDRFLVKLREKAHEASLYDDLCALIRKKAVEKGIKPRKNKQQRWWDWKDFEHEAIAQLLEMHTTWDLELSEEMGMDLPKGWRVGEDIIYYDGRGAEHKSPWYEAAVNLANRFLRPKRVLGFEVIHESYDLLMDKHLIKEEDEKYVSFFDDIFEELSVYGLNNVRE